MSKLILSILVIILSFSMSAQDLSKSDVQEDLNQLYEVLQADHPGLYRYTSQAELDNKFKGIYETSESCSKVQFLGQITDLLSDIKCGHTRADMSQEDTRQFIDEHLFIPLDVRFVREELFVLNAKGELQEGDRIISINGVTINEISRLILDHQPGDGFIRSGKLKRTERYFSFFYALFADGTNQTYDLLIERLGERMSFTIKGVKYETVRSLRQPFPNQAVLSLEHFNDHSYMKIGTFSRRLLGSANLNFDTFLKESFKDLENRNVKNLILDMRGNGGGDDNFGATLVSYFADREFRYFDKIEVTENYKGYGRIKDDHEHRLMTSHRGLGIWKPKANAFKGNVYVLIDGWSFSTCGDVATVLDYNNWVTLIGEETGGGYDGNTSGSNQSITLKHSKIKVNVPLWKYTTYNPGHKNYGRGVMPQYEIIPTIEDYIQGNDPVLQKAIDLINQ